MESVLTHPYGYQREVSLKTLTQLSMHGRRSQAPRPLSEATLIFDTDDEDDDDDESLPSSLTYDSTSTLSGQDEALTPPSTAGLGGFDFYFDPTPVKGPIGPHLFRTGSTDSSQYLLELSPTQMPKSPTRRVTSLPAAIAQLDESQVQDWSPQQVAEWMAEQGFDQSVAEKFLIHDIYGSILLDLQSEDLKEIDIESFGKRKKVMGSIQRLRNSSMIPSDIDLPSSALSVGQRQPSPDQEGRSLSRAPRASEAHVTAPIKSKSKSRRRRLIYDDSITPAESVSIVAIEQVLPEPHICPKAEDCPKWRKQQRKIQRIKQDFAEESERLETKSTVAASVVAVSTTGSSDVLGPVSALPITAERLNTVQPRDPQDSVRQFLDFQSSQRIKNPSPPPAPSAMFAAKSQAASLRQGLPKLRIPSMFNDTDSPDRTPISALRNPSQTQAELKAALRDDPYHYGGIASPVDVYRVGTPMSEIDLPVTAIPIDPCQRDVSQSVPPEMRFGSASTLAIEPIQRCNSTKLPRRRPSFVPAVAPVFEVPPVVTSEVDLANHAGWMRKRTNTRMLRHEWHDKYFDLSDSKLRMYNNEVETAIPINTINVEQYDVHAYTTVSGSKLQSAFKKATGAAVKEPSFAFTLIPEDQRDKKLFQKSANHHFAVSSGRDRVEWMRKLMLAKAMKKNNTTAI